MRRPPELLVAAAHVEDVTRVLAVTGRIEAERTVLVTPQFVGRLTEIVRHEGDRVKAGEVIARIADTAARQELGLMFQTRLPADEGMLFPQARPRVMSMWMKNTYIPLDMLFIDSRGRIVCLLANTSPQSLEILSCPKPVQAVLEIGGGEARERGIRVGDQVRYSPPAQ